MTGTIYLRTDRFEVKLEGITFKVKDFESLCSLDFLFPDGKIRSRPPVVGIDIMHHPRDHNVLLLLLCIGVGCVILRFRAGESLPNPVLKFLKDERIRFVGFALPWKREDFPYEELGLTRKRADIRYLAATRLNDSAYKRSELKELSRKVLGVKRMIGLTDASSFERHEHIKCAICQLFITTAIGMKLLGNKYNQKLDDSPKIMSFLKGLNSLPLLFSEGFQKLHKVKKDDKSSRKIEIFKNDVGLEKRAKESKVFDDDIDINLKMRAKERNFLNDIDKNVIRTKLNKDIQLETQVKKGFTVDDKDKSVIIRKDEQLSNRFVHPKVTEGLPNGDGRFRGNFNLAKVINYVKESVGRKKNSSNNNSCKYISGTPKRHLKGLSGDNGLLDGNFDSEKVINCVEDGVYLSTKGRENYSSDNSRKDTSETPQRHLKGLSGSDGLLDDNFDLAKITNYVKDGVSLSTKERENYSSDNSGKDTSRTLKRHLRGLFDGDGLLDDNFDSEKVTNYVKEEKENYSSDNSHNDAFESPERHLKGLSGGDSLLDDNFDSARVINCVKDGVSLSIKGRENHLSDNSQKGIIETTKILSKDLSNGPLDDNIDLEKVIDGSNDYVSLNTKGGEDYIIDYSTMDTFGTPKSLLRCLSRGNSFYDDNFGWAKVIKFVKDGVSLNTKEGENYPSDDSSKDISPKKPLKGILKRSSSSRLDLLEDFPSSSPSYKEATTPNNQLRRVNSKGLNVSFAFKL